MNTSRLAKLCWTSFHKAIKACHLHVHERHISYISPHPYSFHMDHVTQRKRISFNNPSSHRVNLKFLNTDESVSVFKLTQKRFTKHTFVLLTCQYCLFQLGQTLRRNLVYQRLTSRGSSHTWHLWTTALNQEAGHRNPIPFSIQRWWRWWHSNPRIERSLMICVGFSWLETAELRHECRKNLVLWPSNVAPRTHTAFEFDPDLFPKWGSRHDLLKVCLYNSTQHNFQALYCTTHLTMQANMGNNSYDPLPLALPLPFPSKMYGVPVHPPNRVRVFRFHRVLRFHKETLTRITFKMICTHFGSGVNKLLRYFVSA